MTETARVWDEPADVFPIDPTSEPVAPAEPSAAASGPAPRLGTWASHFQDLIVELDADTVLFTYTRSETAGQTVALIVTACVFTAFVVLIMPLVALSTGAKVLWTVIGIVALTLVAMVMQSRVQTTRLRLDRVGLAIEQGTQMDQESIVVIWSELAGVDLEPVNETDSSQGMCLRLRPRVGETIDTLCGVGVGELNDVRRVINETMARHRQQRA